MHVPFASAAVRGRASCRAESAPQLPTLRVLASISVSLRLVHLKPSWSRRQRVHLTFSVHPISRRFILAAALLRIEICQRRVPTNRPYRRRTYTCAACETNTRPCYTRPCYGHLIRKPHHNKDAHHQDAWSGHIVLICLVMTSLKQQAPSSAPRCRGRETRQGRPTLHNVRLQDV